MQNSFKSFFFTARTEISIQLFISGSLDSLNNWKRDLEEALIPGLHGNSPSSDTFREKEAHFYDCQSSDAGWAVFFGDIPTGFRLPDSAKKRSASNHPFWCLQQPPNMALLLLTSPQNLHMKFTSSWCYKLSNYYLNKIGCTMVQNSSMYFMYFLLFMSIWILLPPVSSPTLCTLIFSLSFLFGLVLSTLHLKTRFSLTGTRGTSLSLAALFPAPCFFSDHPSAFALFPHSSHPWFLSSFSSFFDVPLGAFSSSFLASWLRYSPGKVLTNSSWAVWRVISGRDTYKGILHLSCYIAGWSGSSSSFRVAYPVPLSKLRKMKMWHNLGSIC